MTLFGRGATYLPTDDVILASVSAERNGDDLVTRDLIVPSTEIAVCVRIED